MIDGGRLEPFRSLASIFGKRRWRDFSERKFGEGLPQQRIDVVGLILDAALPERGRISVADQQVAHCDRDEYRRWASGDERPPSAAITFLRTQASASALTWHVR